MHKARKELVAVVLVAATLFAGCDLFTTPQQRIERARQFMENDEYRSAVIELRNVLQDEPANGTARLLFAESAWWLGDVRGAEAELAKLDGSVDDAALRDDLDLRVQLSLGRPELVINKLDGGTAIDVARQQLYRGQALFLLGQFESAEKEFVQATSSDPALADAYVGTIEALNARGRSDEALQRSADLVARLDESALAWYLYGVLLNRSGQTEGSRKALLRADELAPSQLDVPKQAAVAAAVIDIHFAQGDLDAAREATGRLGRLAPDSPLAKLYAARLALADRQYAEAVNILRELVMRAPGLIPAKLLFATALRAQGNLEQANQQLAETLTADPQHLEARQMLAELRLQQNDPDGAMDILIPVLPGNMGNPVLSRLMDAVQTRAAAEGASLKEARDQLEQMLARASEDPETIGAAALFFARIGDVERSRQLLDGAIRAKPSLQLLFAKAQIEWSIGDVAAARQALGDVLAMEPSNREAQLALAGIDAFRGDRASARARLEPLRSQDPRDVRTRLQLARIALADKDIAAVDALVEEAVQGSGAQNSIHSIAGSLYLSAREYAKSVTQFQAATQIAPRNPSLWLNLGRAQVLLQDFSAAEQSIQRALDLEPNWVPAVEALIAIDVRQGRESQALARVAALRKALPGSAVAFEVEGDLNLTLRRYPEAARAYAEGFRSEPSGPLAIKAYHARTAAGLERPEDPLNQWLGRNPGDLRVRTTLAEALSRAGQQREATAEYERVLGTTPNDVVALNNLAWLYYQLGDERAIGMARRAQQVAPDNPAPLDTLGWILVERGQVAEGLSFLRKAAQQPNADPEIRYHHAAALARAGQSREALDRLTALLAERPEFTSRKQADELARTLRAGGGSP